MDDKILTIKLVSIRKDIFFPFEEWLIKKVFADRIPFLKDSGSEEVPLGVLSFNPYTERYFGVGTLLSAVRTDALGVQVISGCRFKVMEFLNIDNSYVDAKIQIIADENMNFLKLIEEDEVLHKKYSDTIKQMRKSHRIFPSDKDLSKYPVGKLADRLAVYIPRTQYFIRKDILETFDVKIRLYKVLAYLDANLDGRFDSSSVSDNGNKDVAGFRKRLKKIGGKISSGLKEELEKQIERFARTPVNGAEYDKYHTWLDFALGYYALEPTKDNPDTSMVWKTLDESHYGLRKVKERIHEELIVRQLNPNKKGPILCFVGPPGVGKTSMGEAIAIALGRKFIQMSLGGVRDESEIRGHRKTYVGAIPGRILEHINRSGASNPVFMIDEIDKVGKEDFRGDVQAALLEVLDPAQNHRFADRFLGTRVDISKVMFITTANTTEGILPALKDRMQIIELTGYSCEEKLEIAKGFLIPRQMEENGVNSLEKSSSVKVNFTDKSIESVVDSYTDEAGVRNLERETGSILRKIAKEILLGNLKGEIKVRPVMLKKFLGPPKYLSNKIEDTLCGVATGVAVTERGGSLLEIEASITNPRGTGKLKLTGNLKKTIQESAEVALGYFRSRVVDEDKQEEKLKNDIHLHVPDEGAVAKDGPSAGVAFASAYYSLFKNKKVKKDLVMTGQITLKGKVLRVGGIKEKVVAAERAGATDFIMPSKNKADLSELPFKTRKKLEFHLVETVDEVLDIAFERKK